MSDKLTDEEYNALSEEEKRTQFPEDFYSKGKKKNIQVDRIYRSYERRTEQQLRDFFTGKQVHCVTCKIVIDTAKAPLVYPVSNSWSITLEKADKSLMFGVPYLTCTCKYNNSILKLMQQVVTVALRPTNW